jgi:hypothetical protein
MGRCEKLKIFSELETIGVNGPRWTDRSSLPLLNADRCQFRVNGRSRRSLKDYTPSTFDNFIPQQATPTHLAVLFVMKILPVNHRLLKACEMYLTHLSLDYSTAICKLYTDYTLNAQSLQPNASNLIIETGLKIVTKSAGKEDQPSTLRP